MTPENIATIEAALEDANVTYRSELFEGAAHGYTMADTPADDQAAAERHHRTLRATGPHRRHLSQDRIEPATQPARNASRPPPIRSEVLLLDGSGTSRLACNVAVRLTG